jgi:hypothetical protein
LSESFEVFLQNKHSLNRREYPAGQNLQVGRRAAVKLEYEAQPDFFLVERE